MGINLIYAQAISQNSLQTRKVSAEERKEQNIKTML